MRKSLMMKFSLMPCSLAAALLVRRQRACGGFSSLRSARSRAKREWQYEPEYRMSRPRALNVHAAPVVRNDLLDNRQPQSGAIFLT